MKLVNEEGRFQFIKNGQVVIDSELPKHKVFKDKQMKEYETILGSSSSSTSSSISSSSNVTLNEYVSGRNVDVQLRKQIEQMSDSNIKQYLLSDDAKEFNEKFYNILKGEVNNNNYSTAIYDNNWDGIHPIPLSGEIEGRNSSFSKKIKDTFAYIKHVIGKKKGERKEFKNSLHVLDFFDMVHVETGKEKEFMERITGYFNILRNAIIMHQNAQVDELAQKIIINVYESVLASNGYNKYIEFGQIEGMKSPGKRVVDIDYIKNFGRIIPQDVVDKKIQCDNMHVFDNYCIMYYDPSGATYLKESPARRDPILFGLINHSEKLYYIADWEDEYCDLTLDKVAELCNVEEIK